MMMNSYLIYLKIIFLYNDYQKVDNVLINDLQMIIDNPNVLKDVKKHIQKIFNHFK